jgi:hypothetical protein
VLAFPGASYCIARVNYRAVSQAMVVAIGFAADHAIG